MVLRVDRCFYPAALCFPRRLLFSRVTTSSTKEFTLPFVIPLWKRPPAHKAYGSMRGLSQGFSNPRQEAVRQPVLPVTVISSRPLFGKARVGFQSASEQPFSHGHSGKPWSARLATGPSYEPTTAAMVRIMHLCRGAFPGLDPQLSDSLVRGI